MGDGRTEAHVIELVGPRAQTDFDVCQAISISDLREGHGQELIPTREVTNRVVAVVALDAAAKLFGMNPLHDLSKNRFSGAHFDSLAWSLLEENRKQSSCRSHHFCGATYSFSNHFNNRYAAEPDDSELISLF
jgi:hypothetical protein